MSSTKPAVRSAKLKMGAKIASRLSEHITKERLRIGDPIGNEAQLALQFQTSRWTMREALSMLHRGGMIEIRRGRSGGYFVAASGQLPFSGAMRTYFEYLKVSIDEIIGARRILGRLILSLAMNRLTLDQVAALRAQPTTHEPLLAAAGNPVAQQFARSARRFEGIAFCQSNFDQSEYRRMISEVEAHRAEQMEYVIAHDFHGAWSIELTILTRSEEMLRRTFSPARHRTEEEFLARVSGLTGSQSLAKPTILTYLMGGEIVGRGWPAGEHLGSEQELMTRYGVGRSVLREAVRPLEQTGLVTMQTGRNSGLKVGTPSRDRLIELSLNQFARVNARKEDYTETLGALFVGAAELAARRHADISEDIVAEGRLQLLTAIAEASGNRIVSTMTAILVAQQELNDADEAARHYAQEEVISRQLIAAVREGDVPLARRTAFLLYCSG